MTIRPEILAKLKFFETDQGGRQGSTPADFFGCLFQINGELYDCRLLLDKSGSVSPGQTVELPIKFLRPELVVNQLIVGCKFHLWDGRIIAEGEVLNLFD